MTAMQRRKGASAERELFALLSDLLGCVVRRNVGQSRAGGADRLDAAELAPTVFEPGRETATLRLEAAAQLMRANCNQALGAES